MTSFGIDFDFHRWFGLVALALCLPAFAGSPTPKSLEPSAPVVESDSGWWWRIAPYGWLPATTGEVGIAGRSADVDLSMSDTLEDLDFSAMLTMEAGNGPWSIGFDGVYGAFSNPVLRNAKVDLDQAYCRAHLGRRLIDGPDFELGVLAGVRYTFISTKIEFRGLPGGDLRLEDSVGWVDPIAGLRARLRIDDRWFVGLEGDIGGFGTGSDLIWQAHAHLGCRIRDGWSALLGYRGLGFEREGSRSSADLTSHGPYAGLVFEF